MPIYRYRCEPCDVDEEVIQKLDAEAPECESCGESMKKQITVAASHFKGEGWDTNTYKKGKPGATGLPGGIDGKQMQENLMREAKKGPAAVEKYVSEGRSD